MGGVVVDKLLFPLSIYGSVPDDIRDRSRKLSEIAQNFGRFLALLNFFGAGLPKIVPSLSLLPCVTSTEKVS